MRYDRLLLLLVFLAFVELALILASSISGNGEYVDCPDGSSAKDYRGCPKNGEWVYVDQRLSIEPYGRLVVAIPNLDLQNAECMVVVNVSANRGAKLLILNPIEYAKFEKGEKYDFVYSKSGTDINFSFRESGDVFAVLLNTDLSPLPVYVGFKRVCTFK